MLNDLILAESDFLDSKFFLVQQVVTPQEVGKRPHLGPLGHQDVVVDKRRYAVITSFVLDPLQIRRAEHEEEFPGPHTAYLAGRYSVAGPEEIVASLPPASVTEEFWAVAEAVPLYVDRIFSVTCANTGFWAITIRQSERPWDKK